MKMWERWLARYSKSNLELYHKKVEHPNYIGKTSTNFQTKKYNYWHDKETNARVSNN